MLLGMGRTLGFLELGALALSGTIMTPGLSLPVPGVLACKCGFTVTVEWKGCEVFAAPAPESGCVTSSGAVKRIYMTIGKKSMQASAAAVNS